MIYGTLFCLIFNFIIGGLSFVPMNDAVGAGLITVTACWVFSYGISYYTIGEFNLQVWAWLTIRHRLGFHCRDVDSAVPSQSCRIRGCHPIRREDRLLLCSPLPAVGSESKLGSQDWTLLWRFDRDMDHPHHTLLARGELKHLSER